MDPNEHANMVLTLIGLGALAIGTLALLVRAVNRWLMARQTGGRALVTRFVDDVKRGEGFTFHRSPDAAPPVLAWDAWMRLVNDRPDEVPHLGIEGATGTTKTTLAEAILSSRQGLAVVITAKPDEHEWGGLPFVTIDDNGAFTTAEMTIRALLEEVARRLVAAKRREGGSPWLTVVLDDFTRLRQKCPSAPELIELVGDQGRSIRVRLILITRSKLVDALGIKGQGDWRDNLVFITLDRQRRASLEWDGKTYLLDTRAAAEHARRRIPPARWWQPDPLLSSLFERRGAASSNTPAGIPLQAGGDPDGIPPLTGEEPPTRPPEGLDDEVIKALHAAGWSMNRIAAKMTKGSKQDRLARIRQAIGGVPEEVQS